MKISKWLKMMSCVPALLWACHVQPVEAATIPVVQLTFNNTDDEAPTLWGNSVGWSWCDPTHADAEMMIQHGLNFGDPQTRLNSNTYNDQEGSLGSGGMAYQSWDGTDWDIQVYNGGASLAITNDATSDVNPNMYGNTVVWERWSATDTEIMVYDGSSTSQLTNNGGADAEPTVFGNSIVWQSSTTSAPNDSITDFDIMHYDGSTVTNLTQSLFTSNNTHADIDGTNVVWQGFDGNDWEIFLFDGSAISQLTNNNVDELNPVVSGDYIAWSGDDGNDTEIFRYSLTSAAVTQITDNVFNDVLPSLFNDTVAWQGFDGNDYEIYVTGSPTNAVPLPAAVWAGGMLLGAIGIGRARRRRQEMED